MKEKLLYGINLFEKEIKTKEKELKDENYNKKFKLFFSQIKPNSEFPSQIKDGAMVRYKKYLITREEDKYYLSTVRETKKLKNEDVLLKTHKNEIAEYIEKKPVTVTLLENKLKEEYEKLGLKYVKKTPLNEKLETLINLNSPLGMSVLEDYNINFSTQIRMKPKKMNLEEALEFEEIKNAYSKLEDVLNSDELILIKISELKGILKELEPLKEELKEEILKNFEENEKNEFFSKINSVKLENKKPNDELNLYQEKISNEFLKNEDLVKELNAEVEKNESIVIYSPFNNLKQIEELLNVQKEFIQKNNIDNSKFGLV